MSIPSSVQEMSSYHSSLKKNTAFITMRCATVVILFSVLASPSQALEGGKPASASDAMADISVAIQAHHPSPDGKMRVSECTGVRIAERIVLTAAHCLDNIQDPASVAVFAYQGAQAIPPYAPVQAIIRHPRHQTGWAQSRSGISERQQELSADMALLKLGASLPTPSRIARIGEYSASARLMGAGTEGTHTSARSGTLKTAALSGIQFTKTGAKLAFASPEGGRVCRGDSGGAVGEGGAIWGISGAILRGKGGCSNRMVVVPIVRNDPDFQEMLRAAQ